MNAAVLIESEGQLLRGTVAKKFNFAEMSDMRHI